MTKVQTHRINKNRQSKERPLHCVLVVGGVRVGDDIVHNIWIKTTV